jgi:hypothetical protein
MSADLDRLEAIAREAKKHGARHEFRETFDADRVLALLAVVREAEAMSACLTRVCGAAWDGEPEVLALRSALADLETKHDR